MEHKLCEARLLCEMILKGNPSVMELLFCDTYVHRTPAWDALVAHRDAFISEMVVRQYFGFASVRTLLVFGGFPPCFLTNMHARTTCTA